MKSFRYLALIALLSSVITSTAQINSPESIKVANELSKKFPDAVVYQEQNSSTLAFSVVDGKSKGAILSIKEDNVSEYFSLKDNAAIAIYETYGSFSSIDKMLTYTKNGKKYILNYVTAVDMKVESDGIFHSDARFKYLDLNFPSKGVVEKTEITRSFTDYKFVETLYFHNSYPQRKKTISIQLPANVEVDLVEFNFAGYNIKKTAVTDPKTLIKTVTYELNDVEALDEEKGSTGVSMNLPHIIPVVKSYSLKGKKTACFESYNDFYAFLHNLNSEVEKDDEFIKEQADKIIQGKNTDLEKIKALYYWVQDNIRYIAFEDGMAGFKPMAAKDVLSNKYGDCKGVANLLTTMLRLEGFNAKFVWIHTNHTKYTCTLPYIGIFNHAICALYWNEKTYFLDCTESYAAFGENAYRIQSRPVMIEDGDTYKIETVPFEDINSSKESEKITVKVVGDKLVGQFEATASGDLKNQYLRLYHFAKSEKKADFFKNYFTRSNSNITVSNVKTSDLQNREVPFNAKYSFELNNQVFKDENELFVNLEFDNYFGRNSKDTLRLTDFTFDMIVNYDIKVELTIPEGYKVSALPPAFKVKNDYCSINLEYTVVEGKVVYKKTFIFPTGVIPKDKAAEYAKIQKDLKKYYTNQITLTK